MTSKDGFSVVAPMRMIVPFSTCGRKASCWALLNRWISSTKRRVLLFLRFHSSPPPRSPPGCLSLLKGQR